MKTWMVLILACVVWAADTPPKPGSETELKAKLTAAEQEARLARLESLVLREQIAVQQVEKMRGDQRALYGEVCRAAGLPPDPGACFIDLNARTVSRREVAAEKPAEK